MKKLLIGSVALAALVVAGPALAADVPVYKAPLVAPPAFTNWYVELYGGWTVKARCHVRALERQSGDDLGIPPLEARSQEP